MSERDFERLGGDTVFDGQIFSVDRGRYRYAEDGDEVTREVVRHPGAVGVLAVDDEHVWLVRQPREAADDPDSLEIPAGKLDEAGESPLDTGKRELVEEIGQAAARWEHLLTFFTSVGILDEQVHLFLATGLREQAGGPAARPDENERIEVVRWPLDALDDAITATRDSKTLIALMLLERRRRDGA